MHLKTWNTLYNNTKPELQNNNQLKMTRLVWLMQKKNDIY